MNTKSKFDMTENGIARFPKSHGQTAEERTMRYNSGACRYELECAFKVLQRTASKMEDSSDDELYKLNMQNTVANSVVTSFFDLGEAMSIWHATIVEGSVSIDESAEPRMLAAMDKFDAAVAALKPYV